MALATVAEPAPGEPRGAELFVRVDVVPPVTTCRLPAYGHLRDLDGIEYLLVIASEAQLREAGWPYHILEGAAPPEDYLVATPRQAEARAAAQGRFRVVYDDGVQWVVQADTQDADALADLGFTLQRLPPLPIIWARPPVFTTQAEPPAQVAAALAYDARVAAIINSIQQAPLLACLERLTGDAAAIAAGDLILIQTRHTSSGAPITQATQSAYDSFEALGLGPTFHDWTASGRSGRNVIATQWGGACASEIVLLLAHLDNMPGSGAAPGADDNGSGVAAVLMAARALRPYRFDRTLRYVLVTGEEQGLLGSQQYALAASAAGDNIVAVFNMDMIAWNGTGGPTAQLHIRRPSNPAGHASDRAIAGVFTNVVALYGMAGSLSPMIDADGESRSDHKSFWDRGYAGLLAIEDMDADFNLYYHTVNDTLAHVNPAYFSAFARAALGTVAHLAAPLGRAPFCLIEVAHSDWAPGSGIGAGVFHAVREEGASATGPDGHDLTAFDAPASPNTKGLKIASAPYGVDLRRDARMGGDKLVFGATLSAVNTDGGGVSASTQLRFAFLTAPETNWAYTANIHVDGRYTAAARDFDCVTNLRTVVTDSGYGYLALPPLLNVSNGMACGTCKITMRCLDVPRATVVFIH